ncbi:hypothetical protein ACN94_22400, partial [Gordonia paraffinivorans]|nr:hypothetical protein [Gordonia paraffinivorans]
GQGCGVCVHACEVHRLARVLQCGTENAELGALSLITGPELGGVDGFGFAHIDDGQRVSPLGWWGFGAGAGRDGLCPVCLEGFGVGHRVVVSELPTK